MASNFLSKLKVSYRIMLLLSIIWLIIIFTDSYSSFQLTSGGFETVTNFDLENFISLGVFPLILVWGVVWVYNGVKEKKNSKE